jgi:hypothetical protein
MTWHVRSHQNAAWVQAGCATLWPHCTLSYESLSMLLIASPCSGFAWALTLLLR